MKTQNRIALAGMLGITLGLSVSLSYGGETARVSVSTAGTQGNNNSAAPDLNENGQFVEFYPFRATWWRAIPTVIWMCSFVTGKPGDHPGERVHSGNSGK